MQMLPFAIPAPAGDQPGQAVQNPRQAGAGDVEAPARQPNGDDAFAALVFGPPGVDSVEMVSGTGIPPGLRADPAPAAGSRQDVPSVAMANWHAFRPDEAAGVTPDGTVPGPVDMKRPVRPETEDGHRRAEEAEGAQVSLHRPTPYGAGMSRAEPAMFAVAPDLRAAGANEWDGHSDEMPSPEERRHPGPVRTVPAPYPDMRLPGAEAESRNDISRPLRPIGSAVSDAGAGGPAPDAGMREPRRDMSAVSPPEAVPAARPVAAMAGDDVARPVALDSRDPMPPAAAPPVRAGDREGAAWAGFGTRPDLPDVSAGAASVIDPAASQDPRKLVVPAAPPVMAGATPKDMPTAMPAPRHPDGMAVDVVFFPDAEGTASLARVPAAPSAWDRGVAPRGPQTAPQFASGPRLAPDAPVAAPEKASAAVPAGPAPASVPVPAVDASSLLPAGVAPTIAVPPIAPPRPAVQAAPAALRAVAEALGDEAWRSPTDVPMRDGTLSEVAPFDAPARDRAADAPDGARRIGIPETRGELARSVASQIAEAVRRLPEGTIELRLAPEELGRVRMSLTPGEGGLFVAITADRPETLDLMRRHVDVLVQDLRQQGQTAVSFAFGQGSGGDRPTPARHDSAPEVAIDAADADQIPARPPLRLHAGGRLDLRL